MTLALWALAGVLIAGMLLRLPIGFAMLASGAAYLIVKRQDLGLLAEQVGNGLYNSYVLLAVPLYGGGLFVACLFCHGELAARRPERLVCLGSAAWVERANSATGTRARSPSGDRSVGTRIFRASIGPPGTAR